MKKKVLKTTYYVVYNYQNSYSGQSGVGSVDMFVFGGKIDSMKTVNDLRKAIQDKYPEFGSVNLLNWKELSSEEVEIDE